MPENFLQIQKEYLEKTRTRASQELEESLPARLRDGCFYFQVFGEPCELYRQEILLGGKQLTGPEGILIALYALHVQKEEPQLRSLKSFKQFPGGMGYQETFGRNAEKILQPYISAIQQHQQKLIDRFSGHFNPNVGTCDYSIALYPLPRVALYYIFDLPDEEFPASVTCLFPFNATHFLPVAGLADVAEYTAKKIIELVTAQKS
jgi:hypothetical protein